MPLHSSNQPPIPLQDCTPWNRMTHHCHKHQRNHCCTHHHDMFCCPRQSGSPQSHPLGHYLNERRYRRCHHHESWPQPQWHGRQNSKCTDFWRIDNYKIRDVLVAILQGANRPNNTNVLSQIMTIIQFGLASAKSSAPTWNSFTQKPDACKHMVFPLMTHNLPTSSLPTLIKQQTKTGPQIPSSATDHCCTYTYNLVHNQSSITDMLKELVGPDGVCKLTNAPRHPGVLPMPLPIMSLS